MSATRILTCAFTQGNNPLGGFVAGDVVDVYYDPSGDTFRVFPNGITVKKNNSVIISGSDISFDSFTFKTITLPTVQICNTSYQVIVSSTLPSHVTTSFPYVSITYMNAPSICTISSFTCDLVFSGTPVLVLASSQTASDGSITVASTSSHTTLYKLNSDFDYADGTGQSSTTFSGLSPGTYRIYARDSLGCGQSIMIVLGFSNSYGSIYRLTYKNLAGHSSKIELQKKGYGGAVTDIIGDDDSGTPFQLELRGEGNLDKFMPIISGQGTLTLVSQTEAQYQELYTNDPNQYRMLFSKDISGGTSYSLQWTGRVTPQVYSEAYIVPPYTVSVVASDGLPDLANIAFVQDDGANYTGVMRVMTLISVILQKTKINLNIRCACNIYASTMTTTASDDPLDQAYVDLQTYYLATTNPSMQFVLTAILKAFRARLVQADGVWNIIRVEEMAGSYNYREFDPTGAYVGNGTKNPIVNIGAATSSNRMRWKDQDQTLEIRHGYGKLRLIYHLGYKDNILNNGDFSLVSQFNPPTGNYTFDINFSGFNIISTSYAITKSYELTNPSVGDTSLAANIANNVFNNVALKLSSVAAAMASPLAYVQSQNYSMAMGNNNSLKFTVTMKIPSPVTYSTSVDGSGNTVNVTNRLTMHYIKIRMRVSYGSYYLQNDGSWTLLPTDVVFYADEFDKYVDYQITAYMPSSSFGTAQSFFVRVYQPWWGDYDYSDYTSLKQKPTNTNTGTYSNRGSFDASTGLLPSTGGSGGGGSILAHDRYTVGVSGTIQGVFFDAGAGISVTAITDNPGQDLNKWQIGSLVLQTGTKVNLYNITYEPGVIYYELEGNTSAESHPSIVRPNDYNATFNPNQWILKSVDNNIPANDPVVVFIDKIQVQYLDGGKTPFDTAITDENGETNNIYAVQDDVYHGSLTNITDTIGGFALIPNIDSQGRIKQYFKNNQTIYPNIVAIDIAQTILAGNLIYAGFLRDSSGNGYTTWKRTAISESDLLQHIWINTTIAQYNRSWKKITGSLYSDDTFFSFINTLKETLNGNILYIPVSMTIDDKNNSYNGEFLELSDVTIADNQGRAHSDGFSSGFS